MTHVGKRVLIGAGTVLGVPLLLASLVLAALGLLQTPAGERWLAARLGAVSSTPERIVTVSGLDVRWPLDLRAERIEVADRAGIWAVAHDALLDWRPRDLLSGTFAAQHLTIGQGEIHRRPLPSPDAAEPASGPPSLPHLPLRFEIDGITVNLRVATEVAGEPLALSAEGGATLGRDDADVALTLRRQGAAAPEGRVLVEYDPGHLALDLALDRPVTGLIIGLAGAARQVPVMDVRITGQGPLSDWRGTVSGTIEGRGCMDGTLRLARTTRLDVLADIGGAPDCLPDPALAQALAGAPMALRANLTFEGNRLTRVAEARLRTAAGEMALSGTLVERLGVRFSAESGELDRLGRLVGIDAAGGLKATGTITGSFAEPVVEARLYSPGGHVGAAGWREMNTQIQVNPMPGAGWLAGTTGSAVPAEAPAEGPFAGPVAWSGTVYFDRGRGMYRLADLRLGGQAGTVSLFGTLSADGGLHLRGLARSGRLEAFQGLAGLPLQGRAVAHVAVSGNAREAIAVEAVGSATQFRSGIAQLDGVLGPSPKLTATFVHRDGSVPRLRLRLSGENVQLVMGGQAWPGMALGWRLDLPDLATLSLEGLSGRVVARGIVTGPAARPQLAGLVEGQVVRGGEPFELLAAIGATNLTEVPRGAFHAGLHGERLTAEVASRFRLGEGIQLDDLVVFSRDTRLTGDLVIADGGVDGRLRGRVADLAPWSDLAGVALAGSLDIDARLAHDKTQGVTAKLTGEALRWEQTRIGRLTGQVDATDLLGQPRGTARLEAAQLTAGGTTLQSLDLRAEGNGQAVDFRLNASGGQGQEPLVVAAQGHLRPAAETQTLRLSALTVQSRGVSGRLLEPTTVTRDADGIRIAPARLDIGGGRIELAGQLRGDTLDLRLDLARAPVKLIAPYLPEGNSIVGTLNAQARVTGTVTAPVVTLDAGAQGLGLAGAGRERLDLTVKARWQDRRLAVDAETRGTRGTTASLEARLPLLANLSVPEDGALRGRLRGSGDLGRLTAALPLPGHRFAGKLDADIAVSGTVGRPDVDGRASLREGFYEYYESGTQLRNVDARLTARDTRTFGLTLSGTDDRRRGKLSGEGRVEVRDAGLAWDVALSVNDFHLVDLDAAQARASGQLTFTGLGENGQLSGKIQVGPAEYHITEGLFGGGVPKLEVVELNRPGGRQVASVRKAAPEIDQDEPDLEFPVNVALALEAQVDRLFVRGRGLESHWRGNLGVGGTARQPTVAGELEAVRGAYDFIGKRFDLANSRVVFDGSERLDPQLDVTGEATANDITAQVKATGPLSKPGIEFASVPALPSDEVLARLLFGQSVGQLNVAQQVQLARAAASLTGQGGFDPIGGLRNQLGLDLLDIGVSEEGDGLDPSVTVGKYLDDKTFLRVEEGLGKTEGNVAIERRVGRGLSVEAEVGRRGSGGVGLNWRMDY